MMRTPWRYWLAVRLDRSLIWSVSPRRSRLRRWLADKVMAAHERRIGTRSRNLDWRL